MRKCWEEALEGTELFLMRILDIGCGRKKHQDAVGVDIDPRSHADCLCNVNTGGLPFKSGTFDRIICRHVLEHLQDLETVMDEIHRVSRRGAMVVVVTPHFTCVHSYNDITHTYHFALNSFKPFYDGDDAKFRLVCKKLRMRTVHRLLGIEFLANLFAGSYEKYWLYLFPAKEIRLILKVV